MKELFYRYNPWWEGNNSVRNFIERPKVLDVLKKQLFLNKITFLSGLRRVGKTTLMRLCVEYLLKIKTIPSVRIFYFSLDDYIAGKNSILEIIEEYRKLHKLSYREKVFLFLDEVTYKNDFELQLKNLHDHQNVKIVAASSSASMLRSKKPYLTGRQCSVEVQPLDFDEYLQFKKIVVPKSDSHLLESYFEDFLRTGGIPEYVLHGDAGYLRELVDDIIYKDIAAFHNIKNTGVLRDFFLLLMERSGKVCSINKISNILKISADTAKRYLQMFADTYLIHLVPRYGKTNETLLAPNKIYAADLGIRTLFTGFRDKGSLFENYVFLKISHSKPYYIYQDTIEIDFYTHDKTLVEVKYHAEFNKKQLHLFDHFKAKRKILIQNFNDLKKLEK